MRGSEEGGKNDGFSGFIRRINEDQWHSRPLISLQFLSDARIFAGVHYRNSADVGKAMGRSIARQTVASLMRPDE